MNLIGSRDCLLHDLSTREQTRESVSDTTDVNRLPADRLHEHIAGLQVVLDVTRELAAEKDLESLLDLIIQRASEALRCERASLFLFDDERQELYTHSVTQLDEGVETIRMPIDKGIVGLVARERRIEHVAAPYDHPEFNPEYDQLTGFHTRNILAAPLIAWGDEEKLLGVLQLINRTDGSFDDADSQLLAAFAAHAAVAVDRAILTRHYEEKRKLLVELDLAKQIQTNLLPRELPDIPDYEFAAISQAADATGGDYYDVIPQQPSGRIGLVVADVSGHGFGPSLLMATARAILRGIAKRETAPDVLVSELADALFDDLKSNRRFITLLYGTLDPTSHTFRYANAGHGPVALHLQARSGQVHSLVEDEARGFPLGWFEESYAACQPVTLAPGDLLVLGTDGLVETRRDSQQFGIGRFCDLLLEHHREPLPDILDKAKSATIEFNESDSLDDDLTLLIVRRRENS